MSNQSSERTRYPGISKIHARGCGWQSGRCRCKPRFQAAVYSTREAKKIRKHFDTEGAARTWREDAGGAVRKGGMRAPTTTTVKQAADALIAGMRDGSILDRSGKPYKPSTVRSYDSALQLPILDEIGAMRLSALDRRTVQGLVEKWRGDGLTPSTVQNTLNPLQVLARRAVRDGELAIDPTDGLELPAIRGRRDRIASPAEAASLIEALPKGERALWACAFYAGLRRGELRALRWGDIDFEAGVIHMRRSWDADPAIGEIDVKSDAGRRRVPLVGALRKIVAEHKLASGRARAALVFGRTASEPFIPSTVRNRALAAWKAENQRRVKAANDAGQDPEGVELLQPIKLHEGRHCAASYLIAAGLNPKQLSIYIGHSDIRTTYNRYGHLMPGDEAQAVRQLDRYFERAADAQGGVSSRRDG
jgi:integrase